MIKLDRLDIREVTRVVFDDGRFSHIAVISLGCGHKIPVIVPPYVLQFEAVLVSPCLDCRVIEP
ncbi:MAG TPA: hypothetical protein PKD75_13665 [Tepidiformaceae bacterium]|nr:hypothetical protein [Tepidiformaceae bacterium]